MVSAPQRSAGRPQLENKVLTPATVERQRVVVRIETTISSNEQKGAR
jgi:hypothetical protein